MRSRSLLIAAAAAVVTFLLVFLFFSSVVSTGPVVVAARALPPGTRLTANDVEVRELPLGAHQEGVFTSVEQVEGLVLAYARAPGDQITQGVIGEQAIGIAASLPKDMRAVAVRVDQSGGMFGVLRPGDRVSVVAVVDPQTAGASSILPAVVQPERSGRAAEAAQPELASVTPAKAARVVISGLRVLLIPQTFRYEESSDQSALAPVRMTSREGVVLLEVPTRPVMLGGVEVSPVELLALLDAYARVHLVLEPSGGAPTEGVGVRLDHVVAAAQQPTLLGAAQPAQP